MTNWFPFDARATERTNNLNIIFLKLQIKNHKSLQHLNVIRIMRIIYVISVEYSKKWTTTTKT